ncbi:hypothetical protein, partial [uncultured Oscillibacter sp.]|uniref:hypothetical protein n=1 Tax=uncultured Oscillibacter sp. TaxID=876091 RepID=UPI0026220E7A
THAIELCKAICGFAPILAASTNSFAFFFALHKPCYVKLHITGQVREVDNIERHDNTSSTVAVSFKRKEPITAF